MDDLPLSDLAAFAAIARSGAFARQPMLPAPYRCRVARLSRKTRRAAAPEDYWRNGARLDGEFESDGETLVIRRPGRW
ncbi:hypothetical protein [Rhizobium mongolense]|uniref:hypothetical protein n=1 Tax=Rhizobium mongolense TaxID=57676 RepID=UPI0034A379D4